MAVISIKNKGKYGEMLAGNTAYDPARFYSIASAVTSGTNTVTFSSIPNTYQHLQLRILCTDAGGNSLVMRFNSDSGSNYNRHALSGNGSATNASGSADTTNLLVGGYISGFSTNSSFLGAVIVDIHDYLNTSKFKTIRSFNGYDANGSGSVEIASGTWRSTSAVTSITLSMPSNFSSGSTFALYGIKG